MSDRVFMRKSGLPFVDKTGETQQPLAFMHYCAEPGCTAWGSFGIGASLKTNQPGIWYCLAHLPPQGEHHE